MSQAFYSAIGGMSAGQTKINVVADNIANMNTVGFKASDVQFSDIYYRTLSSGNGPGKTLGGVNPKQIGIGVNVASIQRDFNAGTTLSTGISTNLSIQGNGFFTVASPTIEVLYTRAGNFSVDGNGNLVLPSGYKALGTDNLMDTVSSTTPIKIPTFINTETYASGAAHMGDKKLSDLNGVEVTPGTFTIKATKTNADSTTSDASKTITITDGMTVKELKDAVDKAGLEMTYDNGVINFKGKTDVKIDGVENGSSTFMTRAAFANSAADGQPPVFSSSVLDYQQTIRDGNANLTTAKEFTSVDIYENGIIEVTYSNNDKLSVMQDPNNPNKMIYKYTTNSNIVISGDDVEVRDGVVEPANLQIQMANCINPNGFRGVGNNVFAAGPNTGMILFGSVSSAAFGEVKSGILEGSNVDISKQFSDMIVAQRAIEANSRVFDTSNQIMKTLSYLGQG